MTIFKSEKLSKFSYIFLVFTLLVFVLSFSFQNKFTVFALWGIALSACFAGAVNRKFRFHPAFIFPIIMFVARFASFMFFPTAGITFRDFEHCLSLLIFPLLFSLFQLPKKHMDIFLILAFFALLINILFGYFFFIKEILWQGGHSFIEVIKNPKLYVYDFLIPPMFWHPSFLAVALSFIIPLGCYLYFEKKISPVLWWISLPFTLVFIFLTGARIGLVISILLLLLSLLYYIKKFSMIAKGVMLLTIVFAILFAYFSPYSLTHDSPRKNMRTIAKNAISESPVSGHGFSSMSYFIQSEEFAEKYGTEKGYKFSYFHNAFLDETVQFGAIGATVFVLFLLVLIINAIYRKDYLLMAFLAIYLPFMYVESPFVSVKGIMPMMFWLCFLFNTQRERLTLKKD